MMQPTYNNIGIGYNSTRQADDHLAGRMFALLEAGTGKQYLDIGCGTGNYTVALEKKGLHFTGVDPSEVMLTEARQKSKTIHWFQGTAENIPCKDESFDGALGSLTLHHWKNVGQGFKELYRVLKPKSKLVFFTSLPEQTQGYWLTHYFPKIIYESSLSLPPPDTLKQCGSDAGFHFIEQENYFVNEDLEDLFLQSGKHNPELYFNENVRKGISTFALLTNKEEVEKGLQHLRTDIDSGKFEFIKQQYDNDLGDYCFVVFEKLHPTSHLV
jgi:ubiquinone/menaquinone biosynthesis C-methylase UbiE